MMQASVLMAAFLYDAAMRSGAPPPQAAAAGAAEEGAPK